MPSGFQRGQVNQEFHEYLARAMWKCFAAEGVITEEPESIQGRDKKNNTQVERIKDALSQ